MMPMQPESAHEERWRDQTALQEIAAQHYVELPYHGFPHVLETRDYVRIIAEECSDNGEPIDPEIVEDAEIAALFHDAGFHIPLTEHGFSSKEVYSADIAATELRALGMPEERIKRVVTNILGTQLNVAPEGVGAKLLRRADLYGVAYSEPKEAIRKTIDLYNEQKILSEKYGHKIVPATSFIEYAAKSHQVLGIYNLDDVLLGHFDTENGHCKFNAQLEKSLEVFLPPKLNEVLRELGEDTLIAA